MKEKPSLGSITMVTRRFILQVKTGDRADKLFSGVSASWYQQPVLGSWRATLTRLRVPELRIQRSELTPV